MRHLTLMILAYTVSLGIGGRSAKATAPVAAPVEDDIVREGCPWWLD